MGSILDTIKGVGNAVMFGGSPFEAANYSSRRSRVPGASPTDFKHEFEGGNRLEVVGKTRYLTKNSGLFREQRDTMALYSVGEGLKAQATTKDAGWNRDAELYFRDWSRRADITERFSFGDIQRLASLSLDTDGEIFVVRTRNRHTNAPRLQMIETHRVGNFMEQDARGNWVDGIRLDASGRPTAIRVILDNGKTRVISMGHVMHVFDPESPSAYRHPPMLTHSVNNLLDESEILALEKHAVKDNSDITRILTNSTGHLEQGGDFSVEGDDSAHDDEATDPKAIQKITGGKVLALRTDETMESFESKRPSPAFNGFIDHLRQDSSLGAVPYGFAVDPGSVTGAGVRLIVTRAERKFQHRTGVIANSVVRPSWFYVIGDAIDSGEMPPIEGWNRIEVGGTKSVSVDAGRNEESNRRDVEAGLKLPSDSYNEGGGDFEDSMVAKAKLINRVKDIAKEHGIEDDKMLFDFSSTKKGSDGVAGTAPSGGK